MKKISLILLAIVLVGLFILHFIAANKAEEQIDRAIQMQADSAAVPMSVQYSSIDVSPFSGDIEMKDVTISVGSNIERAGSIHLDLRYLDFLNITIGSLEYGLKQIESAKIHFNKLSYLNRQTLLETSLSTANLSYQGKLLDGIRTLVLNEPLASRQNIDLSGAQFRYSKPSSTVGTFKSDSAFFTFSSHQGDTMSQSLQTTIRLKKTDWSPPAQFRKKYGFFIQGFGYPLDAIPISNITSSFTLNNKAIQISNGEVETDLFKLQFNGQVLRDSTWVGARLSPLNVQVVNMSQEFQNVLQNIEQLLGISLPKKQNKFKFQLVGPLSNPRINHSN